MKTNKTISMIATLLLGTSIVTGCASAPPEAGKANVPAKPAQQKEVVNPPQKDKNGNYVFTQVGQKITLEDGSTVELVKIKDVNEKVQIKPIEVTIKNIKIFKMSNVPEAKKREIAAISTGNPTLPEPFFYIQVIYQAENKSDKNIDFAGLQTIVLDNGEQLNADMNDFIINDDDTNPSFFGKVKKEGIVGVVIKGKPEEINKVKLIFYPSTDASTYEVITPEQQVEYKF